MKFVIPQNNIKLFAKSILTLSKIGDELYIEPTQEAFSIRTVNSSKSAFISYTFKPSFFSQFEPNLINKNRLNLDQTLNNTTIGPSTSRKHINNDDSIIEEVEVFKCKIPAKSFLSIFKNINSLEKNIEKCTITVKYIPISSDKAYDYDTSMITKVNTKNNQELLYDTKFLVIMTSKHGLRKTFILSISDCENLQTSFSPNNCTNRLSISSKYFHETMNSFSNDTDEVSFIIEPVKLIIKNYIIPENVDNKSLINIQVNFDSDEFTNYDIDKDLETITFCLKEFKICLLFGFWFDLPLEIYFKHKGRPIIFLYNSNPNFEANFTFATLSEDSSTTQNSTLSSHHTTNRNSNQSFNKSNISHFMDQSLNCVKQKPQQKINKGNKQVYFFTHLNSHFPSLIEFKINRRTLFDTSNNQCYLGDIIDNNNEINQNEDEDDFLLSQALDAHQEKTKNTSSYKNIPPTPSPPAKKMKSLVQTLFDENDENEEVEPPKAPRQSLAMFLNMTNNDSLMDQDDQQDKKQTVYIQDTDEEDEDED